MVAGARTDGWSWPALLANRLKVPVLKRGYPGDNAREIGYREGGHRMLVTVTGGTIPASGGVAVTMPADFQVWTAADATQGTPDGTALVGKLNGVPGKIDVVGSTATFTRAAAGQAQPAPFPIAWEDDFAVTHRDSGDIFQLGRNNIGDFVSTIAAIQAMLKYSNRPAQYIVLGILPRTDETTGALNHTKVLDHNAAMSAAFGEHYIDTLAYFRTQALAAAGLTPTADDTAKINAGTIPPVLVSDDFLHLNKTGSWLVHQLILDKMVALGYVAAGDVLAASTTIPLPAAPTAHPVTVAGFTRRYLPKMLSTSLLGTVVTSVPDQTGAGPALAPVVTGSGATYNTAGGMSYLTFDGVANRMSAALTQAQPYTIAMVYRMKTAATSRALASLNNGAPLNPQFVRDSTGGVYMYSGTGTPLKTTTPGTATDWHFAYAIVDGANTVVGVDGNVGTAYDSGAATVTGLRLGEGAGSVFTDYDVAELLFWPTALTTGNMATVRADVKAGHPALV